MVAHVDLEVGYEGLSQLEATNFQPRARGEVKPNTTLGAVVTLPISLEVR